MPKFIQFILLLCLSVAAQAQNYIDKHNHIIEASLGGGNYRASVNNTSNKTGTGGQVLLGLNYEFALSKRFGIGAVLEMGGIGNQKLNTNFSSAALGLKGYYHFYNGKNATIFTSLSINRVGSGTQLQSGEKLTGDGASLQLALGIRRQLFVKWLGFHANLALVSYNLSTWKNENEIVIKNDLGNENLNIKLGGINFTTGLTFKF